ncbi:hypothetical protein EK904_013468 [Melospiza melodia maxima]|nr:hypothetical protein EK904_013468 [Melospiza melodia maxima]
MYSCLQKSMSVKQQHLEIEGDFCAINVCRCSVSCRTASSFPRTALRQVLSMRSACCKKDPLHFPISPRCLQQQWVLMLLSLGGDTPCGWHQFSTGRAISPVNLNKLTSSHAKKDPYLEPHFIVFQRDVKDKVPKHYKNMSYVEDVLVRGLCLAEGLQSLKRRDGKQPAPTLGLQFLSCFIFLGTPSLLCCLSLTEQGKMIPKRFLASSTEYTSAKTSGQMNFFQSEENAPWFAEAQKPRLAWIPRVLCQDSACQAHLAHLQPSYNTSSTPKSLQFLICMRGPVPSSACPHMLAAELKLSCVCFTDNLVMSGLEAFCFWKPSLQEEKASNLLLLHPRSSRPQSFHLAFSKKQNFLKDSACHLSVTAASACSRYFRSKLSVFFPSIYRDREIKPAALPTDETGKK